MKQYDYVIYGSPTCGQCRVAKMIMDKKDIKYKYVDLNTLSDAEKDAVLEIARRDGKGSLPIVMDATTGIMVDWRKL